MSLLVRRTLLALVLAVLPSCVLEGGSDADPESIVGEYVLNGVDPTGAEYAGHLTIEPGEGPAEYHLLWLVAGAQEGTATLDGDRLVGTWVTVEGVDTDAAGTIEFTVRPDGSLIGSRTVAGVDGSGTEEAFPSDNPR
jgi:hypothetical protein